MAASIESATGDKAELIKGESGVFEVVVDGQLIWSKRETGRFPEDEEVLAKLR